MMKSRIYRVVKSYFSLHRGGCEWPGAGYSCDLNCALPSLQAGEIVLALEDLQRGEHENTRFVRILVRNGIYKIGSNYLERFEETLKIV
jgi:hypothetical protein